MLFMFNSPHLCSYRTKLTPDFCGCCSSSRCPIHSAGRGWGCPTQQVSTTGLQASPWQLPMEQPPQSSPKQGGSRQGCPMPCWSQSSPFCPQCLPMAVWRTKTEHHRGLQAFPLISQAMCSKAQVVSLSFSCCQVGRCQSHPGRDFHLSDSLHFASFTPKLGSCILGSAQVLQDGPQSHWTMVPFPSCPMSPSCRGSPGY